MNVIIKKVLTVLRIRMREKRAVMFNLKTLSNTITNPCRNPQIIKLYDAPCHIPIIMNAIKR